MVPLCLSTYLFVPSSQFQPSLRLPLKVNRPEGLSSCISTKSSIFGFKHNGMRQNCWPKRLSIMGRMAGQSGESWDMKFNSMMDRAKKLWDCSPQPVKNFPWIRAFENFIQLILNLIIEVVKYLSIPVLFVSSLSEMSYCAHEKKLYLVPLPFLVGATVAGILRRAALESSPLLKDADVPWHLIAIAIFFTLLKLPGPYYPYWGRICVPHLANGGLLRTLWFTFLWYRKPGKS